MGYFKKLSTLCLTSVFSGCSGFSGYSGEKKSSENLLKCLCWRYVRSIYRSTMVPILANLCYLVVNLVSNCGKHNSLNDYTTHLSS